MLPAAPVLQPISNTFGVPLQAPLILAWLLAVVAQSRKLPALWLTAPLAFTTLAASLFSTVPDALRVWIGVMLTPLFFFTGIVSVDEHEVQRLRQAVRWIVMAVCSAQVASFVRDVGLTSALSPRFVVGSHTDVALWEQVGGQVLGNPNNASVVFCSAFAWMVAERVNGVHGRLWWFFAVVSTGAVWVTGSRGAYLTVILVLLVAAAFHARSRRRAVAITLMAGLSTVIVNYYVTAFTSSAQTADSLLVRIETRSAAIPVILANPLGYGMGSTADALREALGTVRFLNSDSAGATSHDLLLNWGVAAGWIGLLFLLVALTKAFWAALPNSGVVSMLPLVAYLASGQAAGIDVLNATNGAWAVLLWVLVGFAWRGGLVPPPMRKTGPKSQVVRVPSVDSDLPYSAPPVSIPSCSSASDRMNSSKRTP